jgi:hypothetical protein
MHGPGGVHPFARNAGVKARGRSRLLQRVIDGVYCRCAFCQDDFAKTMDKLVEHYGIVIGKSMIREVALGHAAAIHRVSQGFAQGLPEKVSARRIFVVEMKLK